MNDPKRWSDEAGDATGLERELMLAGQGVKMPASERRAVWLGIAAEVALPGPGVARAAPSGGALTTVGTLKVLSVLALAVGGGGLWAFGERGGAEHPAASVVRATEAAAGATVHPTVGNDGNGAAKVGNDGNGAAKAGNDVSAASRRTSAALALRGARHAAPSEPVRGARASANLDVQSAPAPATPEPAETSPAARAPSPKSELAAEARAVLEARSDLRRGDAPAALRVLDAAGSAFPAGSLLQEREALTIAALSAAGRTGSASERAAAFLRRFPGSPHASDVARFVKP